MKTTKDFFLEIWNERPHYSDVSGDYLGETPYAYYFSHVLSKGAYPELKFFKDNVVFMTLSEHQLWEFKAQSDLPPSFDKIKDLAQKLKERKNN